MTGKGLLLFLLLLLLLLFLLLLLLLLLFLSHFILLYLFLFLFLFLLLRIVPPYSADARNTHRVLRSSVAPPRTRSDDVGAEGARRGHWAPNERVERRMSDGASGKQQCRA